MNDELLIGIWRGRVEERIAAFGTEEVLFVIDLPACLGLDLDIRAIDDRGLARLTSDGEVLHIPGQSSLSHFTRD